MLQIYETQNKIITSSTKINVYKCCFYAPLVQFLLWILCEAIQTGHVVILDVVPMRTTGERICNWYAYGLMAVDRELGSRCIRKWTPQRIQRPVPLCQIHLLIGWKYISCLFCTTFHVLVIPGSCVHQEIKRNRSSGSVVWYCFSLNPKPLKNRQLYIKRERERWYIFVRPECCLSVCVLLVWQSRMSCHRGISGFSLLWRFLMRVSHDRTNWIVVCVLVRKAKILPVRSSRLLRHGQVYLIWFSCLCHTNEEKVLKLFCSGNFLRIPFICFDLWSRSMKMAGIGAT